MSQALIAQEQELALMPAAVTPMQMIQMAVQQGADIGKLEQLMKLQERWEANEARKAYVVALNEFKKNPPAILKHKEVDYVSERTSKKTSYKHATLDNASAIIGEALSVHGISHRWAVEQLEDGTIKVTCILTHVLGHSESVSMQASPDTSGNKNSIQAIGSTTSYLQRYTLFAATGIAPKDADDDGRQGNKGMPETVKSDFAAQIEALQFTDAAKTLWQAIAKACHECNDLAAHDILKEQLLAKRKALETAAKGMI